MARKKKTLGQLLYEAYFGTEGAWQRRPRMERIAYECAADAVEREVLRRLTVVLNRQLGIKPLKKKAKGKT